MANSLYICYFGVREPLVQTQVIPYLRELIKGGHEISLLTFEPAALTETEQNSIQDTLRADGIEWHSLKYHKRLSVIATAWDIFQGARFIRKFIARENPNILHGRVHVPTLMAAIARKFSRHKPKILFDIRGFMPEEYTDAGLWSPDGILYRIAKRVERWLMAVSDGFVVLTEKARSILFPESRESGFDRSRRPIEVIPCCVDFDRRFVEFSDDEKLRLRKTLGTTDRLVITHVGALTGLYLVNEIAEFLQTAKASDPSTFALLLTQTQPAEIIAKLKECGFSEADYLVSRVPPAEVQQYLESSDLALSFVRAGYATASRSPTKIPEYLACGLPIIANSGVGDVDELINGHKVGVVLNSFNTDEFKRGLSEALELGDISIRCRETARREFELQSIGGVRYRRLYDRLTKEI